MPRARKDCPRCNASWEYVGLGWLRCSGKCGNSMMAETKTGRARDALRAARKGDAKIHDEAMEAYL